jgi:hypothetical protein
MRLRVLAIGVFLAHAGAPAGAQVPERTASVYAGSGYRAGPVHTALLGRSYRDLWTAPLRAPVLDLSSHAGGLTVTRAGGDRQTRSLRMRGGDGREYVFRSVQKDFPFLPPELRRSYTGRVVLDQLKSEFPAGALALPPLLQAVGVLHPEPRLFVLPDDSGLGEHRAAFAGMLGTLEERPEEGPGGTPGFAGARRVVGTEKLLELMAEGSAPVDTREYLDARLIDLLVGDWDRHGDQWRWVLDETGAAPRWRPVPRDRDKVFSRYDGLLLTAARSSYPRATRFGRRWTDLYGLSYGVRELDRRLLAGVGRPEWEAGVLRVQRALTDSVIGEAVARLPVEFQQRVGRDLVAALRARRDALHEPAEWLFRVHAHSPEVHATARADAAEVTYHTDGRLTVRVFPAGAERTVPRYQRTFSPSETREVRVYLHGGADSVWTLGEARGRIAVRLVGGAGDDFFHTTSAPMRVYDEAGRTTVQGEATVDARRYEAPDAPAPLVGEGYRDWGGRSVARIWVGHRPDVGGFVGGGRTWYRNGFRAFPWASRTTVRAAVAPADTRFGAEAEHIQRVAGSHVAVGVFARASELEVSRFYGFGNDTDAPGRASRYSVGRREVLLRPFLTWHRSGVDLSAGLSARYFEIEDEEGSLLAEMRPHHVGGVGEVGAHTGASWRTRDSAGVRGVRLSGEVSLFPAVWDVEEAFGEAHGEARVLWRPSLPLRPTLVLRGGGARAWGEYPFHAAATVGGAMSVRGFPTRRFAGDGAIFGSAELHLPVGDWPWVFPGKVGVLGVADLGRVYLDGESPGGWHTGVGGGVWFRPMGKGPLLTATAVHGDQTRLYAGVVADL